MIGKRGTGIVRFFVVMVFLITMPVVIGCGQGGSTPQSQQDALKSLSALSDEDKAVEKKEESPQAAPTEENPHKSSQPAKAESAK